MDEGRNWVRGLKLRALEHKITHMTRGGAHRAGGVVRAASLALAAGTGLSALGILGLGGEGKEEGNGKGWRSERGADFI